MSSRQHLIGIAQMMISDNPEDVLVAANLGSCLGIAVYDRVNKWGGILHCLLPLSKSDPDKAAKNPCMYVDTGFSQLMEILLRRGTQKKDLLIVVVGGANINDENNVFEIGKKNLTVLKKLLWKNNLLLHAENCGESHSRTLALHIDTGKTYLKALGQTLEI